MNIYTIYDSPSDYPNTYVCRRWEINPPNNEPIAMNVVMVAQNLNEIRKAMQEIGLWVIPRDQSDDVKIVETWV